jgi:hypothetical protein
MNDFNGGAKFSANSAMDLSLLTLRQNPAGFLVVAIISLFALNLINLVGRRMGLYLKDVTPAWNVISAAWSGGMRIACQMLFSGLVAHAVFRHLRGERVSVVESARRAAARMPSLLGVLVVGGLQIVILASVFLVATALAAHLINWFIAMLLCLMGVLMYGHILIICRAAVPVCVIEGTGPLASLRRGASLTKGRRTRILGAFLLIMIIWTLAKISINAVTEHLAWGRLAASICEDLILMLPEAWINVADTAIYYSLRVEKEGLAPVELAKVFD